MLTTDPALSAGGIVFPALHGGTGEDGTLQALLELRGIPFAGSGRLGCSLAMDKEVTKQLLRWAGIPTPDWLVGDPAPAEVEDVLGFPVIVKPAAGGSTLGLTLVEEPAGLERAVETARRYEDRVLFERYVRGRELTVGILGTEALPVGEIIAAHTLFDYECKYQPGLAEEIFPADIPTGLRGGSPSSRFACTDSSTSGISRGWISSWTATGSPGVSRPTRSRASPPRRSSRRPPPRPDSTFPPSATGSSRWRRRGPCGEEPAPRCRVHRRGRPHGGRAPHAPPRDPTVHGVRSAALRLQL